MKHVSAERREEIQTHGNRQNAYRAQFRSAMLVMPTIRELQSKGITSLTALAAGLTKRRIRTPRGKTRWSAEQIKRALRGNYWFAVENEHKEHMARLKSL